MATGNLIPAAPSAPATAPQQGVDQTSLLQLLQALIQKGMLGTPATALGTQMVSKPPAPAPTPTPAQPQGQSQDLLKLLQLLAILQPRQATATPQPRTINPANP